MRNWKDTKNQAYFLDTIDISKSKKEASQDMKSSKKSKNIKTTLFSFLNPIYCFISLLYPAFSLLELP